MTLDALAELVDFMVLKGIHRCRIGDTEVELSPTSRVASGLEPVGEPLPVGEPMPPDSDMLFASSPLGIPEPEKEPGHE